MIIIINGAIKEHYQNGISNPEFGIVIDNTNQRPEKTARVVMGRIKEPMP